MSAAPTIERLCTNCGRPALRLYSRECRACLSWRATHGGERRPDDRPITRNDRPDYTVTTSELCALSGCSYRQIDAWTRSGRIAPAVQGAAGSGSVRLWTDADVARVTAVVQRIAWGMTVDAAFRTDDPAPVPTPPEPK